MQCKATSKRTGERCKAKAMTGRDLCYHHGGMSLVGPANPAYRDGRYSRYMPKRLLEQYERAAGDGDLLVMRDDVAIVDTRLAELLSKLDSGETDPRSGKEMGQDHSRFLTVRTVKRGTNSLCYTQD